jgi:hypothetical protein
MYFGTGRVVDATEARVSAALRAARHQEDDDDEPDAAVSEWMTRYLAASSCKYLPVWIGQRLVVDGMTCDVTGLSPASPARVAPTTRVSVNP